jgi:hypothetical protein
MTKIHYTFLVIVVPAGVMIFNILTVNLIYGSNYRLDLRSVEIQTDPYRQALDAIPDRWPDPDPQRWLDGRVSNTWEAGMGEDRLLQEVLTEPGARGGQARLQHVQHDRQHRTWGRFI